jgi:hypothetical protein
VNVLRLKRGRARQSARSFPASDCGWTAPQLEAAYNLIRLRHLSHGVWTRHRPLDEVPKEVGGSGIPKPSWQKDPDCSYRTDADVSAESGCQPGIAVYTSIYGGWSEWCGTSVATPFTAGVTALAGNAAQLDAGKTFWKFSSANHAEYFNHPTGRGTVCRNYLCGRGRYEKYYSGPGGWGSPNGIAGY